jgi:hypothetical protein
VSILNGTEPDGFSLDKLYGAPVMWEEQRQVLGQGEQIVREETAVSANR